MTIHLEVIMWNVFSKTFADLFTNQIFGDEKSLVYLKLPYNCGDDSCYSKYSLKLPQVTPQPCNSRTNNSK